METNVFRTFLEDLKRQKKTLLQSSSLFGSKIGVILLGLLIKGIQTRALGVEDYGLYAFFGTLTGFTALFFRFGYFTSLQVLLANNDDPKKERQYFGLGIITGLAISIFYSIALFLLSFFVDQWFDVTFGATLRTLAPLCLVFPLQFLINGLAIGSNRINQSVIHELGSKLLFIIPLSILFLFDYLTLEQVLWLNLITAGIAVGFVLIRFQPEFRELKNRFRALKAKQRSYGRHYFLGNLASRTTYRLDELVISLFLSTTQLGFYNLAGLLCAPMAFMSQALSASMFKQFATRDAIPKKLFLYNTLWLLLSLIMLLLLSGFIVEILFGADYTIVAKYVMPLAFAYFLQGLYQPFTFLAVKSEGKAIRNVSLAEAMINVAGNFSLVFIFGIYGIIATSILAKLVHFLGLYYYYQKYYSTAHGQ